MNRLLHAATALLILGCLVNCATPVGVREVDRGSVREALTANAISANEPSIASRQVMRRLGVEESFRREPERALEKLHALTMQEMFDDRIFALAEYSYLHAWALQRACSRARLEPRSRRTYAARNAPPAPECAKARAYYVAASIYAYAFLFPEDSRQPPSGFDPRLRVAVDIYNLAVTSAIEPKPGEVTTGEISYSFHLGTLLLELDPEELRYADRHLADLVPAARLAVQGLRNRYRHPGIGAPFVASAVYEEGARQPLRSARVPNRVKVPITALVRYEGLADGLRTGSIHGRLEIYTQTETSEVEIAGQIVPLEYETTSALAYGLSRSRLWDFEFAGFLRGDLIREQESIDTEDGLLMLEPYRPGKIPLVFVHGTASSPARWAEMLNEFQSDPIIRDHYQFWFFIYSSGNPILYSASLLRAALSDTISDLDPGGRDTALRRMVVIGHSQGGLLTKLQVISSGTRFWDNISDKPFEELKIDTETRETLGKALFFERQEFIERVIFISTPHRGSFLAESRLGGFASRLVHTPTDLLQQGIELAHAGVNLARAGIESSRGFFDLFKKRDEGAELERQVQRLPSSVDNMKPNHRFIRTLQAIPVDSHVHAHSIIPVLGGPPPEGQNDGVVEYSSAHVDEAESELIVYRSGHSTQSHPDTIQETRRILLEHLDTR
jgi:hypothetical protein